MEIKVLHVDDDIVSLETTKEILEMNKNIKITSVDSANEAIRILKEQEFDVIVSDYQMPQKDGLKLLAQLRERGIETPFILFTGKGREDVAIKALNLGANYYINKNGRPETVYGELYHHIKQIKIKNNTEKLLEENEQRLKKIALQAPGMLYQFKMNPDGSYCMPFSTDAIKYIFGCFPEDVKTNFSPILRVIFEEDVERVLKSIMESAKTLEIWNDEFRVQLPGGPIRWLLGTSTPERLPDGSILWSGYAVDITEQKNALKQLEIKNEMLENVTKNTRSGLSIVSKDFDVLYANKVLTDVFGDVVGKKCYRYFGDRNSICSTCGVKEIFETGKNQVIHDRVMQDKNGNETYLELIATPIRDDSGNIVSVTEIAQNVTEHRLREKKTRESEEKFRTFAEQSPNMIFINLFGRIVYVNKKCVEIMGYTKEEFYDPEFHFIDLIADEDKEKVFANFSKHLKNNDVSPIEYSIITKDGKKLDTILNTKLICYCGQNAILGTVTDITKRKRAEEELQTALGKLQILNEKLDIVGKSTRHDANNKLAVILNNTYLAKMELTSDDVKIKKHLESVETAVDEIKKIFDFSKIYQQLGSEKLIQIDVGEKFDEATRSFLSENDLFVMNDCKGIKVIADSLLKTFFYNLIENSLKHGQKVTSIGLRWVDLEQKLLLIYEDNGVGIPEDEKEKIFEEGFGKGTGMGLHLIKLMCNIYGWTIKEIGEYGKGVKFTITMPKNIAYENNTYVSMEKEG
jgi:PAS domain S-box-containing protein